MSSFPYVAPNTKPSELCFDSAAATSSPLTPSEKPAQVLDSSEKVSRSREHVCTFSTLNAPLLHHVPSSHLASPYLLHRSLASIVEDWLSPSCQHSLNAYTGVTVSSPPYPEARSRHIFLQSYQPHILSPDNPVAALLTVFDGNALVYSRALQRYRFVFRMRESLGVAMRWGR